MRLNSITHRRLSLLVVLLSWGGVGVALFTQHVLDMQPCPWCIAQRLLYILVGGLALLAAALPPGRSTAGRMPVLGVLGLQGVALLGALGIALYQHFVAAADGACMVTAADRFLMSTGLSDWLPEVLEPRANCAEANLDLLGVPYSLWSAMLAVLLLVVTVLAMRARPAQKT